ncbi:MAG TPA: LysR family transcriptional regulator, partial [Casimicrobiaceae bacterium]
MAVGLQGMTAFAETVRQGSFAAAARELGLSPSAVAKSVARLEQDLGLRLLHRTTREVSLTSDGHSLYERCRGIVEAIDALRAEAEGVRGEPSGTLRLNAP